MAYETGVASSPADLLTKFAIFAAANGWTRNSPSSGEVLSKGNVIAGLGTDADDVFLRGATAVANGSAWSAQTGNSALTITVNVGAGPFTAYHFYTAVEEGKDLLAATIEVSSGVFRHWIIADLIKRGAYTGGAYLDGQYHNTSTTYTNTDSSYHQYIADASHSNAPQGGHFWCEFSGSASPNWVRVVDTGDFTANTRGIGSFRGNGKHASLIGYGYQRWNFRTPLWPVELFVNRSGSLRSPAGRVPGMRFCNLRNHTPGEILSIGGDSWQLWPPISRADSWGASPSSVPASGHYGYAFKR